MRLTKLALIALLGGALMMLGCGDDSSAGAGMGGSGTAGTGGAAGGTAGAGGEAGGGAGGAGGSGGATATQIFCPAGSLDPIVDGLFPQGLTLPLEITTTPAGAVTAGADVDIEVSHVTDLILTIPVEASVSGGSGTYTALSGGTGTAALTVPEMTYSGTELSIDGGSGTGTFSVDAGATELVIEATELTIDLSITSPTALDLNFTVGDGNACEFQNATATVTVDG